MTKAIAYLDQLARSRKLMSFAKEHKLSYVYVWQLKTPKTDSRGKPLKDQETGRIIYRRTPSFKIINKLKSVIPTEYWYEEAREAFEPVPHSKRSKTAASNFSPRAWILPDDPFCGVVSAYECDPGLSDHSGRFPSPLPKIILDFSL